MFVKSVKNYSEILTKNLSGELQARHASKVIGGKPN